MSLELTFTTQGNAQVLAEIERQQAALRRQKELAKELAEQSREETRERERAARAIEAIRQRHLTAEEQLQEKLEKTAKLLKDQPELLAKEQQRLRDEYEKTKQKIDDVGQQQESTFSVERLARYALGFVSIHKAVELITEELRVQQEMIDKRTAAQMSVGESRNVLLRNLVGQDETTIRETLQSAARIATETGVSEVAINQALASAVSATSGNIPLSIDLVRDAAKFLSDRPSEIGEFAGTLGDLTRVTGTADARTSLGLLSRVGRLSRITSQALQARNIAPALVGTMAFGGDAPTSGALFAALTTGTGDVSGERTGTALISLAQQLDEAAQGKGVFAKDFKPGDIQGDTLAERIRFLQQHRELAQRFVDRASFERKAVGAITQLLTDPASQIAREFAAGQSQFGDLAALRATGDEAIDIFRLNALQGVSERRRRIERAAESSLTRRAEDRLSTEEIEHVRSLLIDAGMRSFAANIDLGIASKIGGVGVSLDEAIGLLEGRARYLSGEEKASWGEALTPLFKGVSEFDIRRQAPEVQEMVKSLNEAVEELKQIKEATQGTERKVSDGGIPTD